MTDLNTHRQNVKDKADKLINITSSTPLENILNQEKLDLFSALGDRIFLDDESIKKLEYIQKRLQSSGTPNSILTQIDANILVQDGIIASGIPPASKAPAVAEKSRLEALKLSISPAITLDRKPEFDIGPNAITTQALHFQTNILNKEVTFPTGTTNEITITGAIPPPVVKTTESLVSKFTNGMAGATYELYDKNLSKLKKNSSGYFIITMPKKGGGDIQVAMKGLSINGTPEVQFDNIELLNPTTGIDIRKDIDFTNDIELPVVGSFDVGGGKSIAHQKILKFKLNDPLAPIALNDADQRTRYDMFNDSIGVPVNQYIQDFYDNNYKNTEDKLLDELIGDAVSNSEDKKVLRDRIKDLTTACGNSISPFIVKQKEINDGFKEYFFANVKPTADDISTPAKYNDFLKKNIPEQLKIYLDKELRRQSESTAITPTGGPLIQPATRKLHDAITNEILTYRQEQENRAKDDFVDSEILRTNVTTKTNKKIRSPNLTKSGLFGVLGTKDVSYMRFFTGQTQDIGKQTVKLQTDKNKDKVEFTGYEAKLNINYVNNISIDIKMDNGEEFTLKAGNHIALIKSLLKEPRIPYGKMRMHIAYNIIKAMIKIANKNNITVEYATGDIINSLSIDKNDDIILEEIDDTTGIRTKNKLFSEKDFDAENDMHNLRGGLEKSLLYFNKGIEKIHKQYKEATDEKIFGYYSLSRAKFPVSWISSPIKKLMNIRKSRTLNFDFDNLQVEGINNNTSISFSKNTFTITSDLLEKPISSKNLGKLLRTRVKGKRVFDGIERAIGGTIYKNLINKLRENSKIGNTNFGVKDPVKNRVYFIDNIGEVGFISLANNKNPINKSITKLFKNNYGIISKLPSTGRVMLTKIEAQNEMYQNPLIMGKLMKAMNSRLYSF